MFCDTSKKMEVNYMKKRYTSLFDSKKFSDCAFIVENEKILSHKIILASSSPVFEAMLYGPLSISSEIDINDISAAEFNQMLTFVYTDSVKISSIMNAWSLIYIAKKYLIEDLVHYCLNYIKENMEVSNVLLNYEFADMFNELNMRSICLNNIQMYAKFILSCDYHMKATTFCHLLEQNEFNADEGELFFAAFNWAVEECHKRNKELTKDNIRLVLVESGVLARIRFLILPIEDTNNKLNKVLDDNEIQIIQSCKFGESSENKSKLQSMQLCLNGNPRNTISLPQKMGIRRILKTGTVFYAIEGSRLTTKLKVNKCILINGILLNTRRTPENCLSSTYTENLTIRISNTNNENQVELSCSQTLMYGTFHTVKIAEPLLLEENQIYDIEILWSDFINPIDNEYSLYYFSPSVIKNDIRFDFCDPCDCGFIYGICYYPI